MRSPDPRPQDTQADVQFDFGENWKSFSTSALEPEKVEVARTAFHDLFASVPLEGRSFLDIGFGQGLGVCLAHEAGAQVHACDINPKCVEALESTARFFPDFPRSSLPLVVGSILEEATMRKLLALPGAAEGGGFDVVQSWGVLHHTGDMKTALQNATLLVRPGGYFVLAIYNTHWSSPVWHAIKRTYVAAPVFLRKLLNGLFVPVIFLAKFAVTRQNPLRQERGMDFYHDVVDWVGGYPYEHATIDEVAAMVRADGFEMERVIPALVPTGCNQFVFKKTLAADAASGARFAS
jgi:2-polyprenyl-6-hydroxyphenyl methylase/3-demethylubiquinone-9 3-methyltransferase